MHEALTRQTDASAGQGKPLFYTTGVTNWKSRTCKMTDRVCDACLCASRPASGCDRLRVSLCLVPVCVCEGVCGFEVWGLRSTNL